MIVLGVNGGFATPSRNGSVRQSISDGSAALVNAGRIVCATIEERHTRRRYDSGFGHSARICMAEGRVTPRDIDFVAFSSCCGDRFTESDARDEVVAVLGSGFAKTRVIVVPHHESHATLAFIGSGFERAVVAVMDGMGNRKTPVVGSWWRGAFERQSYYLASWDDGFVRLDLVDEDAGGTDEVSIGEIYRAMTHYVGFESYQYAGKTMAIAAYGDSSRIRHPVTFVEYRDGSIRSAMHNRHDEPIVQIRELLGNLPDIPSPLPSGTSDLPPEPLRDLVALLQLQVETAISERIGALCERFAVSKVCLSGGVGLNCVAVGAVARHHPHLEVYVPPAPGDTGQGLGNALWCVASRASGSLPDTVRLRTEGIADSGLGPKYTEGRWEQAVSQMKGLLGVSVEGPYGLRERARAIARCLDRGKVVAIRDGRAEYGPRALGHSSVIGDPRIQDMPERVNRFKRRESYRPYAPSVLAEHQQDFFDLRMASPYMSVAGRVLPHQRHLVPAVVHVDGTARYQTVAPNGPELLRAVIEEFNALTGVPLVLNTSFNTAGVPIVETPQQAVDAFCPSSLDVLSVGPYLAFKHDN